MSILTIINIFIVPAIVALLMFGVLLNIRYTERNVYRNYLLFMFLYWASAFMFVYSKFFVDGKVVISYVSEVASMQLISLGYPCFFTVISYPVVILHSRLLQLKRWITVVFPPFAFFAIYYAYHFIAGKDPFVHYATIEEFLLSLTTISGMLRAILILVLLFYCVSIMANIWRFVPIYDKHIRDNIADSDCNVWWLRRLVVYIAIVTSCYFVMMFSSSIFVNLVYLVSVLLLFLYIVEISIFHRSSEHIEPLHIKWAKGKGWHVSIDPEFVMTARGADYDLVSKNIDKWMDYKRPYTCLDFTTNDILLEFKHLNHQDLVTVFKLKGETFQAYVRRYRIAYACELIEKNLDDIYPKQIYGLVGFSHYSSFSRSFMAVVSMSPSEYIEGLKESKIQGKIPPPPEELKVSDSL